MPRPSHVRPLRRVARGRPLGVSLASGAALTISLRLNSLPAAALNLRSHSWRQPFNLPFAVGDARIAKPVVQTIRTALPKLNDLGRNSVPSPVWRQRNDLSLVLPGDFRQMLFQFLTVRED